MGRLRRAGADARRIPRRPPLQRGLHPHISAADGVSDVVGIARRDSQLPGGDADPVSRQPWPAGGQRPAEVESRLWRQFHLHSEAGGAAARPRPRGRSLRRFRASASGAARHRRRPPRLAELPDEQNFLRRSPTTSATASTRCRSSIASIAAAPSEPSSPKCTTPTAARRITGSNRTPPAHDCCPGRFLTVPRRPRTSASMSRPSCRRRSITPLCSHPLTTG